MDLELVLLKEDDKLYLVQERSDLNFLEQYLCKIRVVFILTTAGSVQVISWSHLWYEAVVVSSLFKFLL